MTDEEKKVPGSDEETPDSVEETPVSEQTSEFGNIPDEPEGSDDAEAFQPDEEEPAHERELTEKERVMHEVKSFLSDEGSDDDDLDDDPMDDDLDDLMRSKRSNISLVLFVLGLIIALGVLGFVLVNEDARTKIQAFVRGDLFDLEKQRSEDLQKLYQEKLELLGEKYGDIRLQYFPRDSKVHIYQTMFRYDDIADKTADEWGDPKEIPNMTLDLKEGEELPYLSIENLPVREKGKLCVSSGQFYPASFVFCPAAVERCSEVKGEEMPEDCIKNSLKTVQYCPQDEKYYAEETGGIMVCPDGKTLMDPAKVPIFVFRYEFLFERKDFLSQVASYSENDWIHLGSGKYIIQFPKDFALLRAWGPVKEKYAAAREKMRCWRLFWGDEWEDYKRKQVLALVREKVAEEAKKKEERLHVLRTKREQYQKSMEAIDIVSKVKQMASIRNGMAEIFYYCPELGKCDKLRMQELIDSMGTKRTIAELNDVEKGIYYGVLVAMKNPTKNWDGMEAYLMSKPTVKVGLDCLQKWVASQKEGQFIPMKDKDCLAALDSLAAVDQFSHTSFKAMFLDQTAGTAALAGFKSDVDNYLQSVDEYKGSESYEDLLFRMESGGKFLEFLILAVMYDYQTFSDSMIKFARSRLVNYRRDAEKRGVVPSDVYKGMKDALTLAFWTGSRLAYDDWYFRLWSQDVQGCLLFAKEFDKERYDRDLKKFEEMVGMEKKGMREQAKGFKDFLRSLRTFAKVRPLLKEANALYRKDRKAFFAKYSEEALEQLKVDQPELYTGIFYLSSPKAGTKMFEAMSKLPEVQEWETPKKQGDQKDFHKYLAYMDVFAPSKLEAGLDALRKRMEPMLMTKAEYNLLCEDNPDLPTYREAIRDIVNSDIHLKYFWLLKLLESPSKFNSEFSKLDLREAKEVSKWIDPERYHYLADLIWLNEMVSRYRDSVPMLMDALIVDYGFYDKQVDKLKNWSTAKSKIVKKYRRSRRLSASLLKEPSNVDKALGKALKMANRFALLAKNLQDYEEAILSTHMANAMEEMRDEMDSGQRDSYAKHVEPNNEKVRVDAGFNKREWESLTKEFEKTAANAEWYGALTDRLGERRLDCNKVKFPEPKDWKDACFSQ